MSSLLVLAEQSSKTTFLRQRWKPHQFWDLKTTELTLKDVEIEWMGEKSWITLRFFFKSCKTNSLGFFFFLKKKKKYIHTLTPLPLPPKKTNSARSCKGRKWAGCWGGKKEKAASALGKQRRASTSGDLGNEILMGQSEKTLSINSLAPVKIWLLSRGRCQLALRSDRSEPRGELCWHNRAQRR